MPSDRPRQTVEFDAEKSPIKLTAVRLVGVIAAVVMLTNMASNKLSAMASDEDVKSDIADHTAHPHPVTEIRLKTAEAKNAKQDAKLAKLEDLPKDLDNVSAKLDTIILHALDRPGRERDSMQRAARSVRSKRRVRPGAGNDPLAGIDGL